MHAEAVERARASVRETTAAAFEETGRPARREDEEATVVVGHPARKILDTVSAWRADLIVLGPHRKRGHLDFGGTAAALLASSPVPIWTQPGPPDPVRSILVPADFSEHSRVALETARGLAFALGARLRLLHCAAPPALAYPEYALAVADAAPGEAGRAAEERALARWREAAAEGGLEVEVESLGGDPRERVPAAAASADLTVLGTHGRTRLVRYLPGGVARGVLARSEGPVLLVPCRGRDWQIP